MSTQAKWKPGKKDAIFLAVVAGVIILLVLGGGKRTTKPTPNDAVHTHAVTRQACMKCHGPKGVRPRPAINHAKGDQCFLCHTQPKDWVGAKRQ